MKILSALCLCAAVLAPLPAGAVTADELQKLYSPYAADSQSALDQPHRSAEEIGRWVSEMVGMALEFKPGSAGKHLLETRPYFSDQGYAAFAAFLNNLSLGDALQKQTLTMDAIANTEPTPIGQGANAGRYAWAFEMPVVLSIATKPGQQPATRSVVLRIQVGRSPKGADPHGTLIENWQEFKEPAVYTDKPTDSQGGGQSPTAP